MLILFKIVIKSIAKSIAFIRIIRVMMVIQKTTILNVILRPPKDLAVLSCKDTVGLTAKTQVNEIKSVKQPDPSEASG